MYQLIRPKEENPLRRYPRQQQVITRYLDIKERLVSYYEQRPRRIPSSHVLVKFIKMIQSIKTEEKDLVERSVAIEKEATEVARMFDFVTYKNDGDIRDGEFFSKDDKEIIILYSNDLYEKDLSNWRKLTPVRILAHDYQDLVPPFLDGSKTFGRSFYSVGYNVIHIDPSLLFYMFSMWKEEIYKPAPAGEKPTINTFVSQFILPSLFDSYIEHAFFNRVFTTLIDGNYSAPESLNSHPLAIIDITRYVDDGIHYINNLSRLKLSAEDLLNLYITPTGKSLSDIWDLDETFRTRHIDWALTVSRLSMLGWVVTKLSKTDMSGDRDLRVKLLRKIRQIKYNNIYPSIFGKDTPDLHNYIERFIFSHLKK